MQMVLSLYRKHCAASWAQTSSSKKSMKCKTAPNFRGGFFVGEISSLSGRAEEVGAKCKFEVSIVTLSKNKNGI